MRKFLGAFLFAIAFLGTIFFRNYQGTLIPFPTLWYVLFLAVGILGVWLVVSSVRRNILSDQQNHNALLEAMKRSAEKIEVDFEKCVFHKGSYSEDLYDKSRSIDLLKPDIPAPDRGVKEAFVVSSYLIYTAEVDGSPRRFISHAFPIDVVILKMNVMNRKMFLYINKSDKRKYFFELVS